jgi:hypothetical protein
MLTLQTDVYIRIVPDIIRCYILLFGYQICTIIINFRMHIIFLQLQYRHFVMKGLLFI